jgi:hypothetical protein
MEDLGIQFPLTPITEKTFKRQGWEKCIEEEHGEDGEVTKFVYWILPLPKDNPDRDCAQLISTANDEWKDYDNLSKGEYCVEMMGFFGLGLCWNEQELEILYKSLTHSDIE